MRVIVNGQAREVDAGTTVEALVSQGGLSPQKVAVELNRRLLKTEKYPTPLQDGDEIEIVTFVGGG
ncbi:MAG: sulfur carrier protein ThiS [Tepidisphaeraceae bacterium]